MRKGIVRIISGLALTALQTMSTIGNGIDYTTQSLAPASSGQFFYDIVVRLSNNAIGIIGVALIASGIFAFCGIHPFQCKQHKESTLPIPKALSKSKSSLGISKSTIILTACVIILSIISCAMIHQNIQKETELQQLYNQISVMMEERDLAEEAANARKSVNHELQKKLSEATSTISSLKEENSNLSAENSFFNSNVVFVPDDNTRIYHKYSCPKRTAKTRSFLAFNIEAAKSRGYSGCESCCPSSGTSSSNYIEERMKQLGLD